MGDEDHALGQGDFIEAGTAGNVEDGNLLERRNGGGGEQQGNGQEQDDRIRAARLSRNEERWNLTLSWDATPPCTAARRKIADEGWNGGGLWRRLEDADIARMVGHIFCAQHRY